jgi:serine protease Do
MKKTKWLVYGLILFFAAGLSCGADKEEPKPAPEAGVSEEIQTKPAPPLPGDFPSSFSELAAKARPSVVNISAVKVVEASPLGLENPRGSADALRDLFRHFFGDRFSRKFKQRSLGSGFIIDRDGLVLTNNHVVANTEEIEVTLADDTAYKAEIVGRDPRTDLALIRIDADKALVPLALGDSDALDTGDWVVAIGNPFGLGNTVTAGIVSAKYRELRATYHEFIQTDASINPGNSGGPLLNTNGRVVGINTAIFSQTGVNIGIGFATPVNVARELLPQLKKGEVVRGWIGVAIQEITPALQNKLGLQTRKGVLVADVTEGGPAGKAGIQRGDIIVSFNGKEVHEARDLAQVVARTPVGAKVEVEVIRKGKKKTMKVGVEKLEEKAMS